MVQVVHLLCVCDGQYRARAHTERTAMKGLSSFALHTRERAGAREHAHASRRAHSHPTHPPRTAVTSHVRGLEGFDSKLPADSDERLVARSLLVTCYLDRRTERESQKEEREREFERKEREGACVSGAIWGEREAGERRERERGGGREERERKRAQEECKRARERGR